MSVLNGQEGRAALYTTGSTDVSVVRRSSQILDNTHRSLLPLHVRVK